jgi:hypothetical protein
VVVQRELKKGMLDDGACVGPPMRNRSCRNSGMARSAGAKSSKSPVTWEAATSIETGAPSGLVWFGEWPVVGATRKFAIGPILVKDAMASI